MVFNTGAALLDAIVLAIVSKEQDGTYGYKITQDVRSVLDVSESTLYPVLRRLQRMNVLETYDMAYEGRNRRYYKLTEKGSAQLNLYKVEWKNYSSKISRLFEGELIYEQKRIYGPAGKSSSDISEDERREALDYYESYFDEAGEAEEASVIQKLEVPGRWLLLLRQI